MRNKLKKVLELNAHWTKYFMLLFMIFIAGCDGDQSIESFDCSTCYQDKPEWGPLQIKVTINSENTIVYLTIYRGDIENNEIEFEGQTVYPDYTVDVPVDKYYSVKAEYKVGDKTIYAVDGDKLKVKKNSTSCDQECYYFKGGYIDVRLRN
jgi:hypothetical protein